MRIPTRPGEYSAWDRRDGRLNENLTPHAEAARVARAHILAMERHEQAVRRTDRVKAVLFLTGFAAILTGELLIGLVVHP